MDTPRPPYLLKLPPGPSFAHGGILYVVDPRAPKCHHVSCSACAPSRGMSLSTYVQKHHVHSGADCKGDNRTPPDGCEYIELGSLTGWKPMGAANLNVPTTGASTTDDSQPITKHETDTPPMSDETMHTSVDGTEDETMTDEIGSDNSGDNNRACAESGCENKNMTQSDTAVTGGHRGCENKNNGVSLKRETPGSWEPTGLREELNQMKLKDLVRKVGYKGTRAGLRKNTLVDLAVELEMKKAEEKAMDRVEL